MTDKDALLEKIYPELLKEIKNNDSEKVSELLELIGPEDFSDEHMFIPIHHFHSYLTFPLYPQSPTHFHLMDAIAILGGTEMLKWLRTKGYPEEISSTLIWPNHKNGFLHSNREIALFLRAAQTGNFQIVNPSLHLYNDTTIASEAKNERYTALHLAAWNNQFLVLDNLLSDANVDINVKDGEGCTPLHRAARAGHLTTVRKLLHKHADPTLKNNYDETVSDTTFDEEIKKLLPPPTQNHSETLPPTTPVNSPQNTPIISFLKSMAPESSLPRSAPKATPLPTSSTPIAPRKTTSIWSILKRGLQLLISALLGIVSISIYPIGIYLYTRSKKRHFDEAKETIFVNNDLNPVNSKSPNATPLLMLEGSRSTNLFYAWRFEYENLLFGDSTPDTLRNDAFYSYAKLTRK